MSSLPAATARCVDCYSIQFRDEMNLCPAGHWTCLACACDCTLLESIEEIVPSWLRPETWMPQGKTGTPGIS